MEIDGEVSGDPMAMPHASAERRSVHRPFAFRGSAQWYHNSVIYIGNGLMPSDAPNRTGQKSDKVENETSDEHRTARTVCQCRLSRVETRVCKLLSTRAAN